jgi:hypothetical protein
LRLFPRLPKRSIAPRRIGFQLAHLGLKLPDLRFDRTNRDGILCKG